MKNVVDDFNDNFNDCTVENPIALAILVLANRIEILSKQVSNLGTGNAFTQMGAIEMLAMEVKHGLSSIAESMSSISESISMKDQ